MEPPNVYEPRRSAWSLPRPASNKLGDGSGPRKMMFAQKDALEIKGLTALQKRKNNRKRT